MSERESNGEPGFCKAGPKRYAGGYRSVIEVVFGMVHARSIAIADKYERAGTCLKHEGKILTTHDRRDRGVNLVDASHLYGSIRSECSLPRMVMRHRVSPSVGEFHSCAMQSGDRRRDFANTSLEEVANLSGE